MKPQLLVKILDRLYVGDCDYTAAALKQADISYVLNVGGQVTGCENYRQHLTDDGNNEYSIIMGLVQLIKTKIEVGDRVLVHCRAGISRSPFLAVKYLEWMGMDLFTAIEFVREKHPALQINQDLLHTTGYGK